MALRFHALVLGLVILFTSLAQAHQQKAAISTVLFNPRTQNVEVMHRFNLHDAEHAVKKLFGAKADIIADTATQARFSDYVRNHFSIQTPQGDVWPLTPVGFEVEGKFIWIYQETPQPDDVGTLLVRYDALQEIWPRQLNTVNFDRNDEIKTLLFSQQSGQQSISFEP